MRRPERNSEMKEKSKRPSPEGYKGTVESRRKRSGDSTLAPGNELEDGEPKVKRRWPPMWLVILLGLLFYWCQLFLDKEAAAFNAEVYAPWRTYGQLAEARPVDPRAKALARGKALYEGNCGLCHQNTGQGQAPLFPPLDGSEWVNTPGIGRLVRIARNGVQGPIEVKGQTFTQAMPNAGEIYSSEDLAAVLSYIRQAWSNNSSFVTPEQVNEVLNEIGGHSGAWTVEQLEAIPVSE